MTLCLKTLNGRIFEGCVKVNTSGGRGYKPQLPSEHCGQRPGRAGRGGAVSAHVHMGLRSSGAHSHPKPCSVDHSGLRSSLWHREGAPRVFPREVKFTRSNVRACRAGLVIPFTPRCSHRLQRAQRHLRDPQRTLNPWGSRCLVSHLPAPGDGSLPRSMHRGAAHAV